ncbi:MAG TPA: twin-arginine translocation signal domain-containing protein, partial [Usitatibacter sp.]
MANRRQFLQGTAAGLCFVGCGIAGHAHAQAPARKREVVVNGKRARTIDVHAHCAIPAALAVASDAKLELPATT